MASAVLPSRHFRVPEFDLRGMFVDYLAATNASVVVLQHGSTVDACGNPLQKLFAVTKWLEFLQLVLHAAPSRVCEQTASP